MAGPSYYIGVDVGTGSARAALVNDNGEILAESTYATTTYRDERNADIFEQSTTEIWDSIAQACRDVVREAKVNKDDVKGIGFDATCSLAVTTKDGTPMSVTGGQHASPGNKRDIILWADHRAGKEAAEINASGSMVLKYVGETMSLEMELPKILWLKRHMPADVFSQCMFFDLPDFLTYRATSDLSRSNCSLACKCSYVPPEIEGSQGWNTELFNKIGLEDIAKDNFNALGGQPGKSGMILTAGQPVGKGLSAQAAKELGLNEGTAVGSGVIDAYAGWIGTIAAPMPDIGSHNVDLQESRFRLAAIAGTSTCHIVQSREPVFVPGVWGPYLHAIFPGYWMNEGGQSSTGQLLDFMLETHPAWPKLLEMSKQKGINHFVLLNDLLDEQMKETNAPFLTALTKNLHIYPDLHGNRSPLADPHMRGMIVGLALDKGVKDLALRYLATCEAIAYQTRHIIDEMDRNGHEIKYLFMSGGLVKNKILMQLLADICGIPIQLPFSHSASVVLGSAMLGSIAATEQATQGPIKSQEEAGDRGRGMADELWSTMQRMSRPGSTILPQKNNDKERKLLDAKYKIFRDMIEVQRKYRKSVDEAMA